MDDWIERILGGEFEITLPLLAIVHGDGARLQGSGRLRWEPGSAIRVSAETDGGDALLTEVLGSPAPLGKLLPAREYVSVDGHTQDGWNASTVPSPRQGYQISDRSPRVAWTFETTHLSLKRPREPQGSRRMIRALMGPPPSKWVRGTTIEVQNEHFGGRSLRRDWLLATTHFGQVAARHRSEQWFEFRVSVDPGKNIDGREVILAVRDAFSFILGRRLLVAGFEDSLQDREERHLIAAHGVPTGNKLLEPLGSDTAYLENVETLLGHAVDFFGTDLGARAAQDLSLCWDLADNSLRAQHAVASICLEALLQLVPEGPREQDREILENDRHKLLGWLDRNPDELSPRFVTRLRGWADVVYERRPLDVLLDCKKRGLFPVDDADVHAWKKVRNPTLHGGRGAMSTGDEQIQDNLDYLFRLQNLLNRVILHLMGYSGRYKDYGQPGWPETDIPGSSRPA